MSGNMGNLSSVINTAISGQKLSQNNAATIANNISNVNTEGFSRKEVTYKSRVLGGVGNGVEITGLKRHTDELKAGQLRNMTSTLRKLEVLGQFYLNISGQMGQPGENNSLSASLNDLNETIEKLSLRPEVDGSRTSLLRSAERLAREINRLSNSAQELRRTADMEIFNQVTKVNGLLESINNLNKEIVFTNGKGQSSVELLDKRDQTLQELSRYMDLRVQRSSNETINVFTTGGQALILENVHKLSFSPSSGIDAGTSYPATINGILIDNDPAKDITTHISEGSLAGYISARDTDLPNFQAILDELTGTLRDEFNKVHNQGTASHVPETLTGTRTDFNALDPIAGSGTVKIAIIDRATGNLVEETILNLAALGDHEAIRAQIDAMGNATATFTADGALKIQSNAPNNGIAIASTSDPDAYITKGGVNFGFSHYFGLNDFFTTGNVISGKSPGVSTTLAVRDEIATNVKRIANTKLDINAALGERAITSGGNQTLLALAAKFENNLMYNSVGTLPAVETTLSGYASIFIQYAADTAKYLEDRHKREDELTHLATQTLETIRGVSLQEEVLELMKWQRQQKVCTQVLKTAEDMLNEIVNIRRR